jgi:nucleotide-binding universal stress UspA family protein
MEQAQDASSTSRPPLKALWIDQIFQQMQGHYGSRFLHQWETGQHQRLDDGSVGPDIGILNAKAVWGRKLAGFADVPEVFVDVIDSALPLEPPSLPMFHDLCRAAARRRRDSSPRLAYSPTADEQAQADEAARLAKAALDRAGFDPLAWAKQPASPHAMRAVVDLARRKRDPRFVSILAELIERGIADEDGQLLMRYMGFGRWEFTRLGEEAERRKAAQAQAEASA